ncbi:EpsG family protein [Kineothrix sp. MB12-C1]|uniref:EpsG family protein n=1 Tax=Kineothrix sp. MB12-C1 TaxID=3070215 RepID=UPI0027D26D3B|nr:EpsG family protein [Kineothrix sp. MB12-C1]WMC91623.1 EpsG family protein [Kineothrix sp. MB12-C1]
MIFYTAIAVVTVLLAASVRVMPVYKAHRWSRQQALNGLCLFSIFAILFAVSACRLNVGNDYAKYVEFMHLIASGAYSYVPTEIGFNALVAVLYKISGYENFLLVFAVFAFVTIFFFLKAMYEQSDNFGFSFFLFMAFGFYFHTFNTVRYYLALALALYSIKYVLKGEWGKFLILILIGSTFHKSLLVVIPLYFLATLSWKKWQLAIMAVFSSSFFFLQDFYLKVVVFLYPSYADTEYLEGGISWFNIMRCAGVLVLSLLYYKDAVKDSRRNRFYFYCNLGALVLYVCCSFLPIITRIGYYLNITQILFLPAIVARIPDKRQKKFFSIMIVLAALGYFALYLMRAGNDGIRVLPYQTFMFYDMVPILSDMN